MKKILSIMLTIAMILSTVSVVAFAETEDTAAVLLSEIESVLSSEEITVTEDGLVSEINTDETVSISETITLADGAVVYAPNLTASFTSEAGATVTVNAPNASLTAGGDLTFAGTNALKSFSASYYNNTINIGADASLEITGTGRVTIGWGNTFNITGSIENAKTTDKTTVTPSLIVPAGVSITGSGANVNVTNAYIVSGKDDTSKNSAANGVFNFNFINSIYDVAGKFCLSVPTSGCNPTFNMNFENSVMNVKSHAVFAAPISNVIFDNSDLNVGSSMRNSGTMTVKNGSAVSVSGMIQAGENGGNDGTIIVDNATLDIECSSEGHAMDGLGNGKLIVKNGGSADVDYIKDSSITVDTSATLTSENVLGESEILIDLGNVPAGTGNVTAPNLNITNTDVISNMVKPADGSSDIVIKDDGTIDYKVYNFAIAGQGGFETLQQAVDAATGNAVINVNVGKITGDVTIVQKDGVNITINGNGAEYRDTMYIHGQARFDGAETLTISGINFNSDVTHDFISSNTTASKERYAHNVTIKDCTFTSENTEADVVATRFRQAYNIKIENCTFTDLHSAMWATGGDRITVDEITTTGCKNGLSVGTADNVVVKNSVINAENGYGIRADGSGDYSLVIEDTTVEADYPVIIRKATNSDYSLELKGESTFAGTNDEGYGVVITSGDDDEAFVEPENDIQLKVENDVTVGIFSSHEASVDGVYFKTIADAVAAASNDDVVIVKPGTYDNLPAIAKSIVITGDPNYGKASLFAGSSSIEKPVINISDVSDGGVKYQALDVTFDNIVFNVKSDAVANAEYYNCALGHHVEDQKTREKLTVTNCDFINNSNLGLIAIMAHIPDYTVTGCTFKNFDIVIYTALDKSKLGTVNVSDNTFENVREFYTGYWGKENAAASLVIDNNKSTDGTSTIIGVYDYAKETIGADATAFDDVTVTDNNATVIFTNYEDGAFDATVSGNDNVIYTYKSEDMLRALSDNLPEGEVYVGYGTNNEVKYVVEDGVISTVSGVELIFVKNTDAEYANELPNTVWDIVLKSYDDEFINRLNSADFTFALDSDKDMKYEIIATNDEVTINNVDNDANRYEFHYKGKTGTATDTATRIKLGTVKFTGYGEFTFGVEAVDTNAAHATTKFDNVVDSYTVANTKLVINTDNDTDEDGVIESEVKVPTKALTINIDFPNAVEKNIASYQMMTVTVTGDDIEPLTYNLGEEMTNDGKYVIEIENKLTLNNAYTVEVSGEGYRTARYTVTMTDAKELNFWNNVKDVAIEVEEGKSSSAKNVTFLAGDIVKDSNINIYDLSAVVSYFGTIDLKNNGEAEKYIRYDLNRDGKIDSKDVAYVLVSWGK